MLVNMSMNLVHLVPDTVLQWIGAQSQSASAGNGAGQDFTRDAAGAMAAGGQVASQVDQAIKGGVGAYNANKKADKALDVPQWNAQHTATTTPREEMESAKNHVNQPSASNGSQPSGGGGGGGGGNVIAEVRSST